MTDLAALIARLEAAEEGSIVLDMDILSFLRGYPVIRRHDEIVEVLRYGPSGRNAMGNPVFTQDPFTRSVDAALLLLPKGWCALMLITPDITRCDVHEKPVGITGKWIEGGTSKVPAIAVCIAALRAREALPSYPASATR